MARLLKSHWLGMDGAMDHWAMDCMDGTVDCVDWSVDWSVNWSVDWSVG